MLGCAYGRVLVICHNKLQIKELYFEDGSAVL
jgi:hypothetical protein